MYKYIIIDLKNDSVTVQDAEPIQEQIIEDCNGEHGLLRIDRHMNVWQYINYEWIIVENIP